MEFPVTDQNVFQLPFMEQFVGTVKCLASSRQPNQFHHANLLA